MHTLLDPNLSGFVCENVHVFYRTVIAQEGLLPEAHTIRPPTLNNDIEILKFWLTDADARKRVPDQLAVVCRRLVEIAESDRHLPRVDRPFSFCLTCGEPLAHLDARDPYMEGLRCKNGHEFWWRGFHVHYSEQGRRNTFSVDMPDDDLPMNLEYYASTNSYAAPYVHPQLREVLNRLLAR